MNPRQATKLSPPRIPATMVPRPRLAALLTRALDHPVTVLRAGPGAGKSLAVAEWLDTDGCPAVPAWLTLDTADNDPEVFWSDVRQALRQAGSPPAGVSARTTGRPPAERAVAGQRPAHDAAGFASVLSEVAVLHRPSVLVLDELDAVGDGGVLDDLGWLTEHLPPELRLLLITRSDPALPLHRLRVRGELTEFGPDRLAFTAAEADELFARHGVVLTPAQRDTLLARTEGWVTGLQLAALSLDPDDIETSVSAFTGGQMPVVEYLVHEVLDHQPAVVRDFLLRTSVVATLSGTLGDALTGRSDSRRILDRLARTNSLVVAVDSTHQWFRCHVLLREVLTRQLLVEHPTLAPELHRRAARWFGRNGALLDAVRQAVAADDMPLVGSYLLRTAVPELTSPTAAALATAVRPLAGRPGWQALLCAIVCHYHDREYDSMEQCVSAAQRMLTADAARFPSQLATVLSIWRITCARVRGHAAEVADRAGTVLAGLRGQFEAGPATAHYRLVTRVDLGCGQLWSGNGDRAADNLATAAAQASQLGMELPQLRALALLAVADGERGRLRLATVRASAAVRIAQRRGWQRQPQLMAAHLALALTALERGELSEVPGHLVRSLACDQGGADPIGDAVRVASIRLLVRQGDPRLALQELANLSGSTGMAGALLRQWISAIEAEALLRTGDAAAACQRLGARSTLAGPERVRLALAHLALGDPDTAELTIAALRDEPAGPLLTVETDLAAALVADHLRRDDSAMRCLERALTLAEPEGIVAPFQWAGPRVTDMLQRHQHLTDAPSQFAARILSTNHGLRAAPAAPVPMAELTDRELAVLRYLATMRSNDEIGEELHITVNTVKAHLKTLYRKLDVTSRREAVHRARDMEILSPVR